MDVALISHIVGLRINKSLLDYSRLSHCTVAHQSLTQNSRVDAPMPVCVCGVDPLTERVKHRSGALCCRGHVGMRSGRGAWMRLPDVFEKKTPFPSGSPGFLRRTITQQSWTRDPHPCVAPGGSRRVLTRSDIHVLPCLWVGISPSIQARQIHGRSSSRSPVPASSSPGPADRLSPCCTASRSEYVDLL